VSTIAGTTILIIDDEVGILETIRILLKNEGFTPYTALGGKKGLEQIKDFTLGGLVPPLEITPEDHEGGGWVKVFTIKGGKFVPEGDWFKAYREVVQKVIAGA